MFGMVRILAVASIILAPTLSGCLVGTVGGPRVVPEVAGMLTFSAYPKAKLVSETGSTDNISFADRPGRHASRVYETTDSRATVRQYYEGLAHAHGWSVYSSGNEDPGYYNTELVRLSKDKFNISVYSDVEPNGNPAPSPSPGPDGTPTPRSGPFRFRVDVSSY
ncbi:hypothetical protein D3C72_685840 [compost metagenome]